MIVDVDWPPKQTDQSRCRQFFLATIFEAWRCPQPAVAGLRLAGATRSLTYLFVLRLLPMPCCSSVLYFPRDILLLKNYYHKFCTSVLLYIFIILFYFILPIRQRSSFAILSQCLTRRHRTRPSFCTQPLPRQRKHPTLDIFLGRQTWPLHPTFASSSLTFCISVMGSVPDKTVTNTTNMDGKI